MEIRDRVCQAKGNKGGIEGIYKERGSGTRGGGEVEGERKLEGESIRNEDVDKI